MTRFLYITLIGILLSFTFSSEKKKSDNEQEITGINIGNKAPELDFKNPDGNNIKLSSLKGNIVLIDFGLLGVFPVEEKIQTSFLPTINIQKANSKMRRDLKYIVYR